MIQGPGCNALVSDGYIPSSRQSDTLLFVTVNLNQCQGQLSATLMYNGFDVTNDFVKIATFELLRVLDTSEVQGIRPSSPGQLSTITISGFGFGLSNSQYYNITFMDNPQISAASCIVTPENITVTPSSKIVCLVDLEMCTSSHTIYVQGEYNKFDSNPAIPFSENPIAIASLVRLTNTASTYGLLAKASQTLTVQGIGFGSSDLNDYLLELRGTNCVSPGFYVPSLRSSSSILILSNVDLSNCTDSIELRIQYEGIWWDDGDDEDSDGDYVAIGIIAELSNGEMNRGYVSTTSGAQALTLHGNGFGTLIDGGILISFTGSNSCSSPNQVVTATRLSNSTLEVSLDISNCEGTLHAFLSYNGLGYSASNVTFGTIVSMSDTGTTQVLESFTSTFVLNGVGFNDDVVSESNDACSSTPSSGTSCYDINLNCSGSSSTSIQGTVLQRISFQSLNVSANLSICNAYDIVSATMMYQGGIVDSNIGVGKIDMLLFQDTSDAYSYASQSVVNITIDGDSFISTDMADYIINITVSSGCLENTYTGSEFVTRISDTRLVVLGVDLRSCTNGTIYASLTYTNTQRRRLSVFGVYGNQIVSQITVGVILSVNNDAGAFGYVGTSNIDVTLSGSGFLIAREDLYTVDLSDSLSSCNINDSRFNVTVVSATTILIRNVNMTGCEGTIRCVLYDGESSKTAESEVGTMISLLDDSVLNGVYATTNQRVTISGTGFASSSSDSYDIVLSDEDPSSSVCESRDIQSIQRLSWNSLLLIMDLTGCVGTIRGTLYFDSKTSEKMESNIAVVTTVLDTIESQGVESDVSQGVTITGIGFSSNETQDYLIRLDDTAHLCRQIFLYPDSVTFPSKLVMNDVDLSSCASSSFSGNNFLTASLSYKSGPFLVEVSIASFNLTRLVDTRTSQGIYAEANTLVTLHGTGFVSDVFSEYTITTPCSQQGLSVTEVRDISTLVSSGDLSLCSDGDNVSVSLELHSRISTETVATIVGIQNTETTQGVIAQDNFEVTVRGYGFASLELTDYNIYFASGGGSSCEASNQVVVPHSRLSDTLLLANVNLDSCVGTVMASLNYRSMGLKNGLAIATITRVDDTKTSYGYSSILEGALQNVTIEGVGFTSSDCSAYHVLIDAGDECDNTLSLQNAECLDSLLTPTQIVVSIDLQGCDDTIVKATLTLVETSTVLAEKQIGQIISVSDTATSQPLLPIANQTVSIEGTGFSSDIVSDYEITFRVCIDTNTGLASTGGFACDPWDAAVSDPSYIRREICNFADEWNWNDDNFNLDTDCCACHALKGGG